MLPAYQAVQYKHITTPLLTTVAVSTITDTTTISGGTITSSGTTSITAEGVCWSTASGPTTANSLTSNGTSTGAYASTMTALNAGTTYYVRAYATNTSGTGYGNQPSFTTASVVMGDAYQGGLVVYVLVSGDAGYDPNVEHGIIAPTSDQSSGIKWSNNNDDLSTTATTLGTGAANTAIIVADQGAGSYAAQVCNDLVIGPYSDWYLPSKDELDKMNQNRATLTGYTGYYWSSSQGTSSSSAWQQNFAGTATGPGTQLGSAGKNFTRKVRAVRSF